MEKEFEKSRVSTLSDQFEESKQGTLEQNTMLCSQCKENKPTYVSTTSRGSNLVCKPCLPKYMEECLLSQLKPEVSLIPTDLGPKNAEDSMQRKKQLQEAISNVENLNCDSCLQKIQASRESLIASIDHFFSVLVSETQSKFNDSKESALKYLQKQLDECDQTDSNVSTLGTTGLANIESLRTQFEVIVNKEAVSKICEELPKYIQVKQNSIDIGGDEEYSPEDMLQISMKNSTVNPPIMCRFKENTKQLYLLPLSESPLKFKTVELNIDFKIPLKYMSLSLPSGSIMLFGGADPEYKARKSNRSYLYEPGQNTLIRKANMVSARIGAGITYLQGYIYLIGGKLTKEGYTNTCEKYSLKTDKWSTVRAMLAPSYLPSVCSFQDRLIYKYGGLQKKKVLNEQIEKYVPGNDKWYMVPYKSNCADQERVLKMQIGYEGRAIQFNETEMFIFGGHDSKLARVNAFVLRYETQTQPQSKWEKQVRAREVVTQLGEMNPPVNTLIGEAVVYRRRLYCLGSVNKGELILLEYDRRKWNTVSIL